MEVQQFIARWSASGASERANKDSYLKDLCDVLGVGGLALANSIGVTVEISALLILLRRRGLWIFGLVMNTLVLLFFFQMYQARPAVIFSPGGLATKAAQILLEVTLIGIIFTNGRQPRR